MRNMRALLHCLATHVAAVFSFCLTEEVDQYQRPGREKAAKGLVNIEERGTGRLPSTASKRQLFKEQERKRRAY